MAKQVVMVTPSLKSGGLERIVSRLANHGAESNRIILVSISSEPSFFAINKEVKLVYLPKRISRVNRYFRLVLIFFWLRSTVAALNADVVCTFGEKYNPLFILSLLGLKVPIYVSNRASPLSYLYGVKGFITSRAYQLVSGVILQTSKSKEILQEKYKFKSTLILGNPIDLDYPQPSQKKIILNVGSFTGVKYQDKLIRIFKTLVDNGMEDWDLHFVGSGPKQKTCEELCDELGLNSRVVFHGVKKNVKGYFSGSSIFAFTSGSEGFPNALAEAMAAGCACISYDCVSGPSDIIDDGENGFLIPMNDKDLYACKLQTLLDDAHLRDKFSSEAILKMEQFEMNYISNKFFNYLLS